MWSLQKYEATKNSSTCVEVAPEPNRSMNAIQSGFASDILNPTVPTEILLAQNDHRLQYDERSAVEARIVR